MKKQHNVVSEVYEEQVGKASLCTYVEVRYFINEAKRTIVCKLSPYVNETYLRESYNKPLNYKAALNIDFYATCDECAISYVGKAECMPEDEFNVDFGKKLAYDKAMLKLLNDKFKFLKQYEAKMNSNLKQLDLLLQDTINQTHNVEQRFEKKIKEVM